MYECEDSSCTVIDTNDYTEQKYVYSKQRMLLSRIYWPIYDVHGKYVNHKLAGEKDYVSGKHKQYIND